MPLLARFSIGLVAGLLASPHCLGMCGAFPLHLSRGEGGRPASRVALYLLGKMLTYAFLGTLAGTFGEFLVRSRAVSISQQALAYTMGVLLVVFGVAMLEVIRLPVRMPLALLGAGAVTRIFGRLLRTPGPGAGYVLGAGTGFLPCPITLAMLTAAAAAHSAAGGAVILVGLGVGTAPALLAVGLSGAVIDARVRRFGLRGAGVVLLALGVITLLRPTGTLCRFLPTLGGAGHSCCAHETR
jgi:sulfite exporter TauE/SafE